MKYSNPQRRLLQATPVAAAVAALLCTSGIAQAQTAPAAAAPTGDVVVITGIRRAIESAISVKKNADQIVEAISAEDLGKLPDTSIAESISRLPGVAAQRTAGRAQQISIRGMAPDFSTSLLNGREQASTGDSRSANFDQYPSELLNGVVIYKTPDGALVGQGLSGTIDLQTVRPLDFSKRELALAYRSNKLNVGAGGGSEGDGKRYSVFYVDQFADRTIGVALGFARLDEKGGATSRFESWGGGTAKLNGAGADLNVPYNGFNAWLDQETRKRDGYAATLQFKPNKNLTSTLDYFYSKFDKVKASTGFQAPLNDSWNGNPGDYDSGGVLTAATGAPNVTAGTFNNVRAVVRNDSQSEKTETKALGWNTKFKFGEWTGNVDLSQSKAKSTGGIIETTAGTAQAALRTAQLDTVQFTSGGKFTPGLNYANRSIIKLTDVQGWGGGTGSPQAGYSKLPFVDDEIKGYRFSAKKDMDLFGVISAVEGGLHLSDRNKERSFTEGRLVISGDTTGLGSVTIPGGGVTTIPTPGGSIDVASFDSSTSVGSIYQVVSKKHPDIFNKDWKFSEKVTTAFVKGDVDTSLAGLPLRGNVGMQLVATDQSSTAFNVDRRTCTSDQICPAATNTAGATYTDILPSLNLAADFGNVGTLRFALARVMARPKVDDMRASSGFGLNTTDNVLEGSGGNPALKPFRANAVDVSYEKYFGTKAYVGVAGFYKQLSTYIVNLTNPAFDFSPYVTASTVLPARPNPKIGKFTQPVNGNGGNISGIELSGSLPLNMVADVLDGFGMFASYSSTSSSLNLSTAGFATDGVNTGTIPLPGLSKRVANYGVYFEKWGFSARVAARSRSDFVGEVSTFTGDRQLTYVKGETITDAQIGYEFGSGWLKGLSLRAEISNTGNTPFVRFRDVPSNEVENKKDGKFYQIGLNYRM